MNLLNPYHIVVFGRTVVVIQCPHCEEDVELEDGVSGVFDCPHCGDDFSYGDEEFRELSLFQRSQLFMSTGVIIGLVVIAIGVITFLGFAIFNDDGGEFGSGMWIFIPCGIFAVGIPIVVISFFVRGWRLNWKV